MQKKPIQSMMDEDYAEIRKLREAKIRLTVVLRGLANAAAIFLSHEGASFARAGLIERVEQAKHILEHNE